VLVRTTLPFESKILGYSALLVNVTWPSGCKETILATRLDTPEVVLTRLILVPALPNKLLPNPSKLIETMLTLVNVLPFIILVATFAAVLSVFKFPLINSTGTVTDEVTFALTLRLL
jgi:hypothetical protein